MEIVIKLSDETYKDIKEENCIYGINNGLSVRITGKVVGAIQNGTPLPKGHGALKDTDMLLKYGSCPNDCVGTPTCDESYEHLHCPFRIFDLESINDTPTIIEADKKESEEKK